jgi:peptidoglycan hydrolase-like protein with peptidoglycan-binding domain
VPGTEGGSTVGQGAAHPEALETLELGAARPDALWGPARGLAGAVDLADLPLPTLPDLDFSDLARPLVPSALAGALLVGTLAGPAEALPDRHRHAASARPPATPYGLPAGVESLAALDQQSRCDPSAKPGVLKFRRLVLSTYPNTGSDGIVRACGIGGTSEHKEGRAWDWKVSAHSPTQRAEATALLRWLLATDSSGHHAAMARRLGIMYIVWDRHMWRAYDAGAGWQPYTRGEAHTDHVHFSFSRAGAAGHTSFWRATGKPAILDLVARARGHVLRPGDRGAAVRTLQTALHVRPVTGRFGPSTTAAVRRFQRAHGLAADGVVGKGTWSVVAKVVTATVRSPVKATATHKPSSAHRPPPASAIPARPPVTEAEVRQLRTRVLRIGRSGPAVLTVQRLVGATPTGRYDATTRRMVARWQAGHGLPADGVVGSRTWTVLTRAAADYEAKWWAAEKERRAAAARVAAARATAARRAALLAHRNTVLRLGAKGAAVVAVQRRLGMHVDGVYGERTMAAVSGYQRRHHLVPDGVCGPRTWVSLAG